MSDSKTKNVKIEILDQFKELQELLPTIQETIIKCLEKDISREIIQQEITRIQSSERLNLEKDILKEISSIFKGKWMIDILFNLFLLGKPHFNELQKSLPNIGSKILTDRLKYLEEKKIVIRSVLTPQPIRVTYSLSEFGLIFIILLFPVIIHWVNYPILTFGASSQ